MLLYYKISFGWENKFDILQRATVPSYKNCSVLQRANLDFYAHF